MKPCEMLAGQKLSDGWTVVNQVTKKPNATGGNFSTGYICQHEDGRRGFLKAMDYTAALQAPNTAEVLQIMTKAYLFEKQICEQCRTKGLHRVVHAINSGSVNPQPSNPAGKVEYLIFPLADGDIRSHLNATAAFDLAFVLRTLHEVATGVKQLHAVDIAHQDLKPSNVLVFPLAEGSKLSDLGRAWASAVPSPYDAAEFAGDWTYAPIEAFYRFQLPDLRDRHFAFDLYLLGSFMVFMFTQVHINGLVARQLPQEHIPRAWGGSFDEVLPHLRAAYSGALSTITQHIPAAVRDDIMEMIIQLCEPDPRLRGHPSEQAGYQNPRSLQRFISRLDLLAYRTELSL